MKSGKLLSGNSQSLKLEKNSAASLKAVKNFKKPAEVFSTRFHPETSEDKITSFVASQFSGAKDIKCKKL